MKRRCPELSACLLLLALAVIPYAQVAKFVFVNFDDPVYVTHNMSVQAGLSYEGIEWAFTETKISSHWHPLTWVSLLVDYDLHGLDPAGYHLTNLALHVANTLLLFAVLRWGTGSVWRSAVVAGLFAAHPLHVESVAWISERKDVLSTFFWMLTTLAYFWYRRPRPDCAILRMSGRVRLRDFLAQPFVRYCLLLNAFACGLLAKSMVVTLPGTLFLLDCWPLRRPLTKWLILEKVPLFLLAVAAGVMTLVAMGGQGTLRPFDAVPFSERIGNALIAYAVYLRKMVWPVDLAAYYPLMPDAPHIGDVVTASLVLGAITAAVLLSARRRPYLLVGWLWYVGTLAPVAGFVQVGSQALADRYTYVPLIGIFIMLVWGSADLVPECRRRAVLVPFWGAILLVGVILTHAQAATWRDSVTLWRQALAVTDDNFLAHRNLGMALWQRRESEEALSHLRRAVQVHDEMAAILRRRGRTAAAAKHEAEASKITDMIANFSRQLE